MLVFIYSEDRNQAHWHTAKRTWSNYKRLSGGKAGQHSDLNCVTDSYRPHKLHMTECYISFYVTVSWFIRTWFCKHFWLHVTGPPDEKLQNETGLLKGWMHGTTWAAASIIKKAGWWLTKNNKCTQIHLITHILCISETTFVWLGTWSVGLSAFWLVQLNPSTAAFSWWTIQRQNSQAMWKLLCFRLELLSTNSKRGLKRCIKKIYRFKGQWPQMKEQRNEDLGGWMNKEITITIYNYNYIYNYTDSAHCEADSSACRCELCELWCWKRYFCLVT